MRLLSGTTLSWYPCSRRRRSRTAVDATIAITLDTYSHAIPALQEEAPMRTAGLVPAASSHCPPATKGRGARRTELLSARRAAGTGAQKSAMTSFFICIMCA